MDDVSVVAVAQADLSRVFFCFFLKVLDQACKKCSRKSVGCLNEEIAIGAGALHLVDLVSAVKLRLYERWPSGQQVNLLDPVLLRVQARVPKQQRVQLAPHIVHSP